MKNSLFSFYLLFLFTIGIAIYGCVSFHNPPNDVGFNNDNNLIKFEGKYKNLGVSSSFYKDNPIYFSEKWWPFQNDIQHSKIEKIEIKVKDDEGLMVYAYSNNEIVKTDIYAKGKDFEFKKGRIKIIRKPSTHQEQSIIIGPSYEKAEIGVDINGDGKFSYTGSGAGLAYCLVPIAAVEGYNVRFTRINE